MTLPKWQHVPEPRGLFCDACRERWPCDAEDVRSALGDALLVLESLWLAEHDGSALCGSMKENIRDAIKTGRDALGIRVNDEIERAPCP